MTDLFHFVVLVCAIAMIGVGLWLITPAAMWVGVGTLLLAGIISARIMTRHPIRKAE